MFLFYRKFECLKNLLNYIYPSHYQKYVYRRFHIIIDFHSFLLTKKIIFMVNSQMELFHFVIVSICTLTRKRWSCEMTLYFCVLIAYDTLSCSNIRFCDECESMVDGVQKYSIWRVPPVLIIHLKRFSVNKYIFYIMYIHVASLLNMTYI